MTDEELIAEIRRRLGKDDGGYEALAIHQAAFECGYTLEQVGPDAPQRLWVLTHGNWSYPGSGTYRAKGAPPAFLGGDEFGNRTACLRLPGQRLLVLNLSWPMKREPWQPTEKTS